MQSEKFPLLLILTGNYFITVMKTIRCRRQPFFSAGVYNEKHH